MYPRDLLPIEERHKRTRGLSMVGSNLQLPANIITVASGKGGVGKTNVAVSLGLALSKAGRRVILLDMDLGLANVDVVLGVRPENRLRDVLSGSKSITEVIIKGPSGLGLISGGSGDEDLANLGKSGLKRLTDSLHELAWLADYIIVDTSAGLSRNTMSFTLAADEVVVVTTPEPTAMVDAYALIKTIFQEMPEQTLRLLVNMARDERDALQIINRLSLVVKSFSGHSVQHAGYLPYDEAVGSAVRKRKPFLLETPNAPVSLAMRNFARKIITDGQLANQKRRAMLGNKQDFLHRLASAFRLVS